MGSFWWIPALVPLLGAIILLLSPKWPVFKWHGATDDDETMLNWKKFGIYLAVNLVLCGLIAWGVWACAIRKQYFHEVWNMRTINIRHEMEWTTHETYTTSTTVGSGKNAHTVTTTHHYTEHHGPFWYRDDEYGHEFRISQGEYDHWKQVWKSERQIGIHKGSSAGWDSKIDGPIYESKWPQTFETVWPATEVHSYVNKIRVSNSILRYGGTPSEALSKRYPRPVDVGNTSPVVNYGGPGLNGEEMLYLQRINASMGSKRQIHPILVVFGRDADQGQVSEVLTAWQGPNMNELLTFVSLDGNKLRWVEVHSWMDNTTLHATLRDELMGQPFSMRLYGELLQQYVPKLWLRKDFTPINEYLHVSVSPGWMFLGVLLSTLVGVGVYLVIENTVEVPSRYRFRRDYPW